MRGVVAAMLALLSADAGVGQGTAHPAATLVDKVVLVPDRFDPAFGGISGIAYDRRHRTWLLLSDDRSDHAPARFYTAKIDRSARGRWRVSQGWRAVLRDGQGNAFPVAGQHREAVDPEAIRVAPDGSVLWTTEGDAKDGYGPAVRRMDRRGRTIATEALPANLRFDPSGKHGTRDNLTLEGLDVTPDGATWLAMEGPLIEDGLPAGDDRPALVRFTRRGDGGALQFVYPLDAVPASVRGKRADNGVSEILAVDDTRMLVIERSGVRVAEGQYHFHCRLYLADFAHASDVSAVASLKGADILPATKNLLFDFDNLPANPGNLEGMAWWPSTRGRRDRIVLVNDNNFVAGEPTRLLLLSLAPDALRPLAR
ncbi:esterase-like activity of phytase family protein [Sphingomonas sp. HMP9]|uniref:esterase-like activity of phytase family protein n=1 Tax=Sphingomonas sp. HMP9 TaxID=1517554 RepID=UPI001E5C91F4|nr:esterase-like activity of phytase family protein [Sphingomonas sp. HMP9]